MFLRASLSQASTNQLQTPPDTEFESYQKAPLENFSNDEIVVVGNRSGPRLWRIENQLDDGRAEIFVLVSVNYIPGDMDWNSEQVSQVLQEADSLIMPSVASTNAANNARLMGTLLRTFVFNRDRIRMKKGVTLADKVGPSLAEEFARARLEVEAREQAFKARQENQSRASTDTALIDQQTEQQDLADQSELEDKINNLKPERAHPFIQYQKLISDGNKSEGLHFFNVIEDRLKKLAKKQRVKSRPISELDIAFTDIKTLIKSMKDFSKETNQKCIQRAIDYIDNGLDRNLDLANAWAQGNIDLLKARVNSKPSRECMTAVSNELGGLKTLGGTTIADFDATPIWVNEFQSTLSTPGVHLLMIPYFEWLSEDGVLDQLKKGDYKIYGPDIE